MVCPKCGVSNNDHSWRCRSCYTILRESAVSTDYSDLIVQSPLRQAQQPNLTPVDTAPAPGRSSRHAGGYPSSDEEAVSSRTGNGHPDPRSNGAAMGQNQPAETSSRRKPPLYLVIATITLLAILAAGVLMLRPGEGASASALFAEAETQYNSRNYLASMAIYQKFSLQFPEDHLAPIAHNRVAEIKTILAEAQRQKTERVASLLQDARSAFRKQRFLVPEGRNVITYTAEVLQLDPTNADALEMQALVINYYEEKAEAAREKRHYNTAIQNYRNMLKILPNDQKTLKKLEAVVQMSIARK
ncbi:MAG: hypothetical protein H6628_06305 [Calditrichae bacterium]|nr:hypothetical protein [Calditrichia bacterium]